jgi:hypothetical protein
MQNAEIQAWAKQHSVPSKNLADHANIFQYFAEQVEAVVTTAKKTPAWWNDRQAHLFL